MKGAEVANLLNELIEDAPDIADALHKTLFVTHSPRVVDSKVDFFQISETSCATNIVGILNGLIPGQRITPVITEGRLVGFTVNNIQEHQEDKE